MAITGHELEREARRVLPRLDPAFLEKHGNGFAVVRRPGGKTRLTVSAALVAAFAREGWIAGTDGCLMLTVQGMSAAARMAGGDFRRQHGEVEDLGGGIARERAVSALDALGRLKDEAGQPYLAAAERDAAARLEADFERAQLRPRLTLNIETPAHRGFADGDAAGRQTASALDARRRVMDAMTAAGPGIADLLFETVCLSRGLNEAERMLGWPRRAGKAVVRIGLQRLAAHYGLTSGMRRPGRIEAWMEAVAGAMPAASG